LYESWYLVLMEKLKAKYCSRIVSKNGQLEVLDVHKVGFGLYVSVHEVYNFSVKVLLLLLVGAWRGLDDSVELVP
jgi:hypothetical protein